MAVWTFMDFARANGVSVIQEWVARLDGGAQAAIDTRLLAMRAMPQWPAKFQKKYKTAKGKIFEIRIPHNKVQYRLLGCYGPERHQFTLLVGTIEKGWRIPKGDVERAERRYALVGKDGRHVCEHEFG